MTNLNNQNVRNYDQQFRGLYFLPNGACLMLLNEEVIEQVMKNSIIINFNQISNMANSTSKDQYSLSNSNNNNNNNNINNNTQISNSSNNKYQSQKNSQDQAPNSKIGKISKPSFNNIINNSSSNLLSNNINSITNNLANLNKPYTFQSNSMINNQNIKINNKSSNIVNNKSNMNTTTNNNNIQEFSHSAALAQNNHQNDIVYIKMNSNSCNSLNNHSSNLSGKIEINNPNCNVNDLNLNSMSNDPLNTINTNLIEFTDSKRKIASSFCSSAFKKPKNSAAEHEYSVLNSESEKINDNKSAKTGRNDKDSNIINGSSMLLNNSFITANFNEEKHQDTNIDNENIFNSNYNLKLNNNNDSSASEITNYFSEAHHANLEKTELPTHEVISSCISKSTEIHNHKAAEINKNHNDSKEKAIFINEILESQVPLESVSRFKKIFEVYTSIAKNFSIELKDLVDLLKKFSLVSPNLNSNESFNFNNFYFGNEKDLGCKSDILAGEFSKKNNSNLFSGVGQSLKTNLIIENNNNVVANNNFLNNLTLNSTMLYVPLGFDLLKYFNDKETSDLKIIVGNHIFYVHKVIFLNNNISAIFNYGLIFQ